jgi:peptidoglycan/LPS O-acetylase OafA/YrhL
MESKGRLFFLDGLRGIAAMMVVLFHLVGRTSAHWVTSRGYLGVAIFFVLSGFVIAMVVGERKVSPGFLGRFVTRRALRLDPPYWTSLVISIGLMYLATQFGVAKDAVSAPQVLAHLFYVQDLFGFTAISEVYWTLCLEIQFYLFLIVLLWIGRQRVSSWDFRVLLVALMVLSLLEQARITDLMPRGLFVPYWFGFSAGAITYWTAAGRLPAWFLLFTSLLLIAFIPFAHGDWFAVTALTAGLLYLAFRLRKMDVWLTGRIGQFLGKTSYSLYLFHPLMGWSAQSLAVRYMNQWGALAVGIAVSVGSAWVTYLLIEKPAIRLSRFVNLERRAPAPRVTVLSTQ